jgi:hypothetical protein
MYFTTTYSKSYVSPGTYSKPYTRAYTSESPSHSVFPVKRVLLSYPIQVMTILLSKMDLPSIVPVSCLLQSLQHFIIKGVYENVHAHSIVCSLLADTAVIQFTGSHSGTNSKAYTSANSSNCPCKVPASFSCHFCCVQTVEHFIQAAPTAASTRVSLHESCATCLLSILQFVVIKC